jgi:signal transduction histidine kinase
MNNAFGDILLLSGIFNLTLLLVTLGAFWRSLNKASISLWVLSITLNVSASVSIGYFYNQDIISHQVPGSVLIFSYVSFMLSYLGLILFFRNLEEPIETKKIILILGVALVLLTFVSLATRQLPLQYRSLMPATISTLFFSLFLAEVYRSNRGRQDYLLQFLKVLVAIILLISIGWLLFLLLLLLNFSPIQSFAEDLIDYDYFIRGVRVLSIPFIFLISFLYWLENFSPNALTSKAQFHKIQTLLDEKDSLISNLSNTRSLVETGALAAGLAHELNQYLAGIQLNAEESIASLQSGSQDLQNVQQSLDRILTSNQQAAMLISNLRKLYISDKLSMELEEFHHLIQGVTALFKERLRKSNVQLELALDPQNDKAMVSVLMRQVIANLLGNSIESFEGMMSQERKILIKTSFRNNIIEFELSDNGTGISEKQLANLFTLFVSTKYSGLGIGLWLCRYIVEGLKGKINCVNLPEGGVAFKVQMPLAPPSYKL